MGKTRQEILIIGPCVGCLWCLLVYCLWNSSLLLKCYPKLVMDTFKSKIVRFYSHCMQKPLETSQVQRIYRYPKTQVTPNVPWSNTLNTQILSFLNLHTDLFFYPWLHDQFLGQIIPEFSHPRSSVYSISLIWPHLISSHFSALWVDLLKQ